MKDTAIGNDLKMWKFIQMILNYNRAVYRKLALVISSNRKNYVVNSKFLNFIILYGAVYGVIHGGWS